VHDISHVGICCVATNKCCNYLRMRGNNLLQPMRDYIGLRYIISNFTLTIYTVDTLKYSSIICWTSAHDASRLSPFSRHFRA